MLTPDQAATLSTLTALRCQLHGAFIGRDAEVDALLMAVVGRTHLLLLGPPGTAKSLITSVFSQAIGGRYFQRLLTPFTTPEEVMGPYDLGALDAGRYERAVDGYLPTAEVAFLDEVFKANSAILNSLLTLLNERQFDQGNTRISCPLEVCVGASNEYPADASLEALYDRFMLRRWVEYVPTRADRLALLQAPDPASQVMVRLTEEDVSNLQALVSQVTIPETVLEALLDVTETLGRDHGLVVSDRRLRSSLRLIQAHALLRGRMEATTRDLMVLADSVWHRHEQRPAVVSTILEITAPALLEAQKIADSAREVYDGIGDFRNCPDLASHLSKVQSMEDLLVEKDPGNDPDYTALLQEVKGIRKSIARGFAQVSGLLRGLAG